MKETAARATRGRAEEDGAARDTRGWENRADNRDAKIGEQKKEGGEGDCRRPDHPGAACGRLDSVCSASLQQLNCFCFIFISRLNPHFSIKGTD